jgi:xylan 1,4-beta-xylosidase
MIRNPILPGFNPDPSICRVEDDFFIAVSTFEWYPGVQIHQSRDLKNWRLAARPLNRAALLDMRGNPDSGGVWAPCLSWHDGLFYLIYTDVKRLDSSIKDAHNYLTTCETVGGTWSDPVYLNSSGFDPSLFHDDDGRKWLVNMVWDTRHERNHFGGIYLQEYCPKQKKLIGDVVNIFKGTELGFTEAPHLYRRNGYYYLVTAEGGTGYTHAMTLARSRKLAGPYEADPQGYLLTAKDHPELELQRAGHGSLFDTPTGETYLVHLCGRPLKEVAKCPLGRETALQKTQWTEDGWLRLQGASGDGLPQMMVPTPDIEEQPWPQQSTSHEFDSETLPSEFQWLRTPEPETFMSLTDRPGFLRLKGKSSLGNWFEQALVARRQEAFCFSAETKLEFSPDNFQQRAGLVCYYNAHKYHYLYVSVDEQGRRYVDIASCLGDATGQTTYMLSESRGDSPSDNIGIEIPQQGAVWLRCDIEYAVLIFAWSLDGKQWQEIPVTLDYSLISDEAGKGEEASFTGAFVGMCCQDVSGADNAADFDYFHYTEVE